MIDSKSRIQPENYSDRQLAEEIVSGALSDKEAQSLLREIKRRRQEYYRSKVNPQNSPPPNKSKPKEPVQPKDLSGKPVGAISIVPGTGEWAAKIDQIPVHQDLDDDFQTASKLNTPNTPKPPKPDQESPKEFLKKFLKKFLKLLLIVGICWLSFYDWYRWLTGG